MNTEQEKRDLIITRIFDAPLEQVWQAWSNPALIKQWWGPDGFDCPLAEIDFREGGISLVCMSSPDFGEHYSLWQYEKIVPMKEIDYIHNLADKDGNKINPADIGMPPDFPQDQRQLIIFTALDANRTELVVTEFGWTVGQMMELSEMGMRQCLDKMAVALGEEEK